MIAPLARRGVLLAFFAASAAGIVVGCGDEESTGPGLAHTPSSDGSIGEEGDDPIREGGASDRDGSKEKDGAVEAADAGPEYSGEATYYDTTGLGACGIPTPADDMVAAINDEQYSKANCGKCVSVTGPKGTTIVRVIDKCPGCDYGDLDLSETAFPKIANKRDGRVKITWRFVDCP